MNKVLVTVPLPEAWYYVDDNLNEAINYCQNMLGKSYTQAYDKSNNNNSKHLTAIKQYRMCYDMLLVASATHATLTSVSCKVPTEFCLEFSSRDELEDFCRRIKGKGIDYH